MAAASAGDPTPDPAGVPDMQATMLSMMDSITSLQTQVVAMSTQIGLLSEERATYYTRYPGEVDLPTDSTTEDEKGPAVRLRMYDLRVQADRAKMDEMQEVTNINTSKLDEVRKAVDELEANFGLYSSELTSDRDNIEQLSNAVNVLRTEATSSRTTGTGVKDKSIVTSIRGFDKLKTYKGTVSEWKEWRFKLVTWLSQSSPSYETLIVKLDYCESEPIEPRDGLAMTAGTSEITAEEEWCSEQLYQLLVQKCEGPALDIIRNQNTKGKARGLVAWYRTLREAEGQIPQKWSEITEKVFQPDRKAVAAKDVVSTLEAYESDIREYQILTGNRMDETMMVVNLKKMMPEAIRERLETLDLQTYSEAKEYAIKQSRNLKKTSKSSTLDPLENEEETEDSRKKKTRFQEESQEEEEEDSYSRDDFLAWLGKGPGKGKAKGNGKGKNGKGGFQGTCHYCGVYGHRINECRKKDADMKGKGKGQDTTWSSPSPDKGKGKGQKGFWKGGKGTYGKGKGAYSVEDDWSSGYSGYSFDTPLFSSSLAQEAAVEWKEVKSKRANKPAIPTGHGTTTGPCHISTGRYHVLSDTSYNPADFDYDIPFFVADSVEGDVPPSTLDAGHAVGSGVDVVDQTSTGCETTQGPVRRGSAKFWAASDKYTLKHKQKIDTTPRSTFVKVFPLNSTPKQQQ